MSRFPIKRRKEAVLALVVLVLIVGGGGAAVYGALSQTVHLLNGSPSELAITIDEATRRVPAGGRETLVVRPGLHHVIVRAVGNSPQEMIDEDWVDVPSADAVVYNALGAALFCREEIRYAVSGVGHGNGAEPTCYPGTTFLVQKKVDYAFTEPPKSIEMQQHENVVSKSVLAVEGDWKEAVGALVFGHSGKNAGDGGIESLAHLFRGLRQLPETGAIADGTFLRMTEVFVGPSAALSLARGLYVLHPDDERSAWNYSTWIRNVGLTDQLNGELRENALKKADSADAQQAFLRNEPPAQAVSSFRTLLAKAPSNGEISGSLAVAQFRAGDVSGAVKTFEKGWADAPDWGAVSWYAMALAETGHPELAAGILSDAVLEEKSVDLLVQYASLYRSSGSKLGKKPEEVASSLDVPGLSVWLEALLPGTGWEQKGENNPLRKQAADIQRAAQASAESAWDHAHTQDKAFLLLYAPVRLLLALEFERAGDPGLARKIEERFHDLSAPLSMLHEYVRTGKPFPEMVFMEPEVRAAVHFVRARALDATGQDARAEYELATRDDIFKGPLTVIMKGWPRPMPRLALGATAAAR